MGKRILLCGHRSFAAKGLAAELESQGHKVVCFSRGRVEQESQTVTGPVNEVRLVAVRPVVANQRLETT